MAPVYLLIQLLESNVLTPMVVKQQLSIPAAGMLMFQLVAALAFGFLGVLLAVPILAVIITLVRELYSYDALGLRKLHPQAVFGPSGRLQLSEGQPTDVAPTSVEVAPVKQRDTSQSRKGKGG